MRRRPAQPPHLFQPARLPTRAPAGRAGRDRRAPRRTAEADASSSDHSPRNGTSSSNDGAGLTAAEVADLLATVGHSSKRDIFDLPCSDSLGQFGIGLLSCFIVADEIVIRSRSTRSGAPGWSGVDRLGKRHLPRPRARRRPPVGKSVHLTPRFDQGDLLRTEAVRELATAFAEFLPVQVELEERGSANGCWSSACASLIG